MEVCATDVAPLQDTDENFTSTSIGFTFTLRVRFNLIGALSRLRCRSP
jgi:hypothetical protein